MCENESGNRPTEVVKDESGLPVPTEFKRLKLAHSQVIRFGYTPMLAQEQPDLGEYTMQQEYLYHRSIALAC